MAFHRYHVIVTRGVCHVIPDFTVLIKKKNKRKGKMSGAWLESKQNSLQILTLQSK